jgi:predicted HTH domain antitoxin
MGETTLQVQIPAELMAYGLSTEDVQRHIAEWLVLSLFTDGRISSGKAACLLAMPRIGFLALLRRRGIAYVDMSDSELAEEFAAVQSMEIDSKP